MDTGLTDSSDVKPSTNWREELSALLVLGVPMAAAQIVSMLTLTIDLLMISRVGAEEIAAASLALVVNFLLWMIAAGPVMAVTPLVSQALGADKHDYTDVRHSVRMGLWLIVALIPLLVIVIWAMEPLASLMGQDPAIASRARDYMALLAFGWPFMMGVMALRNFLAAINKTTIPFLLILLTAGLNAVFNYILIFGNFGAPKLDLLGAGIASSLAGLCSFVFFIIYIKLDSSACKFDLFKNWHRPDWPRFRDVVKLGWPISVSTIFEGMLFNAGVLLMGVIGVMEMAAYQIGLNVASLAFMVPWGLSMAGAVRIGHAAGAGNLPAAKRAASVCVALSTVTMTILALAIALSPNIITALYVGPDAENDVIRALVIGFLPLAAGFMFFDAIQVAANQLLRGLKDVQIPMVMTGISYWIIGFPVAYYLGLKTDVGANGIWYGLTAGLLAASIFLGARLFWVLWVKRRLRVEN
ncbi:MATE family efflux transporter [Fretibacter rubidus]|uniref:MATE family efflux transporter n=1 Tax=Fretibacter rubidus TaxID=570162 RepID=UPI00352AD47A